MRQRNLAVSTRPSMGVSSGRVESQYFVGSFSPSGHSMSSHSSGWGVETFQSREAGRIRTAAKREDKVSLEPSRHGTMRQASSGSRVSQADQSVAKTDADRIDAASGRLRFAQPV